MNIVKTPSIDISVKTLNFQTLTKKRENIRAQWQLDFDKNYRHFATELSKKTFFLIKETLEERLSDPYKKALQINDKILYTVKLDFWHRKSPLVNRASNELPPFSEWTRKASFEDGDIDYFKKSMLIVGKIVNKQLCKLFPKYLTDDFAFDIKLESHQGCYVAIDLWLKAETSQPNPSALSLKDRQVVLLMDKKND